MGYLKVKYRPTGNMMSGYFTNPLQGAAIREFRAKIQRILEETPDTDLVWDRPKGNSFTYHSSVFIIITEE